MKTAAIIAARMGSTRFPGKVLADLNGKPVLQHVIERCKASDVDEVIVAIPPEDRGSDLERCAEALCKVCSPEAADFFVLKRLTLAATQYGVDVVVRVNSDCPLMDPVMINELLRSAQEVPEVGYHSFWFMPEGTPAVRTHAGLPELITTDALYAINQYGADIMEHVTWLCHEPNPVRANAIAAPDELRHAENTIDTPEDLERIAARCRSRSTTVQ